MQARAAYVTFGFLGAASATTMWIAGCGGGSTAGPPTPAPTLQCASVAAHAGRFVLRPVHLLDSGESDIVPGAVAVRFASGRADRLLSDAAGRIRGTIRTPLDATNAATLVLPAGMDPKSAAEQLKSMAGVVAASPLIRRHLEQVIPNDPDIGTLPYAVPSPSVTNPPIQWDMYKMHLPDAWAQSTGFGSSSIKIAIIDTGYDMTNPDLFADPATRVAVSIVYDLKNGMPDTSATAQDTDGHGTDTTGIAAADTNNATDVAGTAGNVTLLEARVFPPTTNANPCPTADTQDVAAAIKWAVANGANVISMSLGSSTPDTVYEEPAVAFAIAHNVTVVAAAGNGNKQGVGQPVLDYPAADPHVIAAGASALNDAAHPRNYQQATEKVASYSNYVPSPVPATEYYVVAPGGDIDAGQAGCGSIACVDFLQWITNLYSTTAHTIPGQLVLIEGTSMSAPHVAGVAALMLSKNSALTPDQIGVCISNTAVNIGDPKQGHGRVDAFAALNTPCP